MSFYCLKYNSVTLAVAICPSLSTLSIVPVGKYGKMKVNDLAKYLQINKEQQMISVANNCLDGNSQRI